MEGTFKETPCIIILILDDWSQYNYLFGKMVGTLKEAPCIILIFDGWSQ